MVAQLDALVGITLLHNEGTPPVPAGRVTKLPRGVVLPLEDGLALLLVSGGGGFTIRARERLPGPAPVLAVVAGVTIVDDDVALVADIVVLPGICDGHGAEAVPMGADGVGREDAQRKHERAGPRSSSGSELVGGPAGGRDVRDPKPVSLVAQQLETIGLSCCLAVLLRMGERRTASSGAVVGPRVGNPFTVLVVARGPRG